MIIYVETSVISHPRTITILQKFPKADVIEILHYKNVFDKNTAGLKEKKSLIIASLTSKAITQAPE